MQMALGGELPWGEHDIAGLAAAAVTSPAAVLSLAASTSFSNGSTATMVPDDGPGREGLASGQWKEWAAPDSPTIGALHHETLVNAAPVRRDGGDLDMDTINQIIACAATGAPESVAAPGVQTTTLHAWKALTMTILWEAVVHRLCTKCSKQPLTELSLQTQRQWMAWKTQELRLALWTLEVLGSMLNLLPRKMTKTRGLQG